MKNKGFSLVELLVTISIIGILSLIAFPLVNNLIQKNQRQRYDNYKKLIEQVSKKYMDDMGFLVSGCYEISYQSLEEEGLLSGFQDDCKETKVHVFSDDKGKRTDIKVNLVCKKDGKYQNVLDKEYTDNTCEYKVVQYKDGFHTNVDPDVNAPELKGKMLPVKYYEKAGKYTWVIADKNNLKTSPNFDQDYAWYLYSEARFANAVFVKEEAYSKYIKNNKHRVGMELNQEDVESFWVWVPRFAYKEKDIEYLKGTTQAPTTGFTLHSAFKASSKTDNKSLLGFWISKNKIDFNKDKSAEEQKGIMELFAYGMDLNKTMKSHIIGNSEYEAAYFMNDVYTRTNESKIKDLSSVQLVGGNYYTTGTPILHYDYTVTGKLEASEKRTLPQFVCNDENPLACTAFLHSNCAVTCKSNYNICYYHKDKVSTSCQSGCTLNTCKNYCERDTMDPLYVNFPMLVNVNEKSHVTVKAPSTLEWIKYVEPVKNTSTDTNITFASQQNLSCSTKTTVSDGPFLVDIATPWVFREGNKYTDEITDRYKIHYDAATISEILKTRGKLNAFGLTDVSTIVGTSVSLTMAWDEDYVPKNLYTRFSLYY